MVGRRLVHENPMLFDDRYFSNPYTTYVVLHQDGKIHRACLEDGIPVWLAPGYDEVQAGWRDRCLARRRNFAGADYTNDLPHEGVRGAWLLMEDPPEHTHSRRLINFAFIPKRVDEMRPRIQKYVDQLLDDIEGHGEIDIMERFGSPLPNIKLAVDTTRFSGAGPGSFTHRRPCRYRLTTT